jgi:hypothetical protein
MSKKTKTTKGKIKCVTVTEKNAKGNRVTSLGDVLPKGIYLRNKDVNNPSYRAVFYRNGKQIYVGDSRSIKKLSRMLREAMNKYDSNKS